MGDLKILEIDGVSLAATRAYARALHRNSEQNLLKLVSPAESLTFEHLTGAFAVVRPPRSSFGLKQAFRSAVLWLVSESIENQPNTRRLPCTSLATSQD